MQKIPDIFVYCPNCKGKLLNKVEYKECSDCHRHYFFNPKPTVTILLTDAANNILLTRRAIDPYKDWWDLPGGFVETGETLEAAALRELREETGLKLSNLDYVDSIIEDYNYREELHPVVATIFAGQLPTITNIKVGDDVNGYKFVPVSDVNFTEIAFENQRAFLTDYLRTLVIA